MARQARNDSVAAATGSVLEIQYLHPPTGVRFPCGRHACATCMYTPKGMDGQGLDDWLHSAAVHVAENSTPMFNEHPRYCMLIQVKKRKMCIIIEASWYSSAT